ncbi:hypothetical protein E2C01_090095 [Portunus trituberculatus]|uniref:Uncharacterized protein n=1 Tax=Portunus trituberculatus TaxID=210409 RepID=A0A5B7JK03_PORTR|nr:hypothetical protein [Portunus trituberculatus]
MFDVEIDPLNEEAMVSWLVWWRDFLMLLENTRQGPTYLVELWRDGRDMSGRWQKDSGCGKQGSHYWSRKTQKGGVEEGAVLVASK